MNLSIKNDAFNYLLISITIICGLIFSIYNPHKFPIDDGFFYLQIAKNIILHGESTFHSITNTNGYHPLWLIICVFLALIAPVEPDNFLQLVFLFQGLIFVCSLYYIIKICKICEIDHFITIGILSIVFIGKGSFFLMETFIAFFFLVACLNRLLIHTVKRKKNINIRTFIITSIISSLLILSRLDLVFFVSIYLTVIATYEIKLNGFYQSIKNITCLVFPLFLIILIYLLFNYFNFGIFFPISGLIKSYKTISFSLDRLGTLGEILYLLSFVFFLIICARKLFFYKNNLSFKNIETLLLILFISSVLYFFYICFYIDAAPWYFTISYVFISIFFPYLGKLIFTRINFTVFKNQALTFLILIITITSISFSYLKANTNYSMFSKFLYKNSLNTQSQLVSGRLNLALEMNDLLKPKTSVLVFDTPGILAFYSQLKVFPSDGLMNNLDYNEDLIKEGALKYFCSRKINYALTPIPPHNNLIFYGLHLSVERIFLKYKLILSSPIYNTPSDPIFLTQNNLIKILVNPLNKENGKFPFLGLWKLPCEDGHKL